MSKFIANVIKLESRRIGNCRAMTKFAIWNEAGKLMLVRIVGKYEAGNPQNPAHPIPQASGASNAPTLYQATIVGIYSNEDDTEITPTIQHGSPAVFKHAFTWKHSCPLI